MALCAYMYTLFVLLVSIIRRRRIIARMHPLTLPSKRTYNRDLLIGYRRD